MLEVLDVVVELLHVHVVVHNGLVDWPVHVQLLRENHSELAQLFDVERGFPLLELRALLFPHRSTSFSEFHLRYSWAGDLAEAALSGEGTAGEDSAEADFFSVFFSAPGIVATVSAFVAGRVS